MQLVVVVGGAASFAGKRPDVCGQMFQAADVFKCEDVVRLFETGFFQACFFCQGMAQGSGIRFSLSDLSVKGFLYIRGIDALRCLREEGAVTFRTEGETIGDTEAREKLDAAAGEVLCTADGKDGGQLEHERCTAEDGMGGALPFVEDGGAAALCETAAHKNDDARLGVSGAYGFNLMDMSVVKWIVFCDDADGVQKISSS